MAKPKYTTPQDQITFSIINEDVLDRLISDGEIALPRRQLDIPKDEQWNAKQMTSKILQGIQNGDAIPDIATSLMQVIGNNTVSAVRNARTMVTSAENHGRLDSYQNLENQGVVQKKVWIATADDRTRESHLELDGEEVDINDKFSNGCMFPADESCGDPSEVWNCRCSMRDHIIGFRRADGTISYVNHDRDDTGHSAKIDEEKERRATIEKAITTVQNESNEKENDRNVVTLEGLHKPERPASVHREDFDSDEAYWEAREKHDEEYEAYKIEREAYNEEVNRFIQESIPEHSMSMDEFQNWCDDHNIKIYGDISEVDGRALTAYTERMEKLSKDFPEVMTFRENFPVEDQFKKYEFSFENTHDYVAEASHGFYFGSSGTNIENLLWEQANAVTEGFRTLGDGTLNQLFDHEFGHNLYNCLRYQYRDWSKDLAYDDVFSQTTYAMKQDLIKSVFGKEGMSEYATTNDDELYAEAFSAWYGGEQTEFARAFGEFLERWRK